MDPVFKIISSPLFWTSLTIPGLIAGALVGLRWDNERRFQSSSDFLVVPLTVDIGIWRFPDQFLGNKGVNLSATADSALLLAVITAAVLVWNVKRVEPNLNTEGMNKTVWLVVWCISLTLVAVHGTSFAGLFPFKWWG